MSQNIFNLTSRLKAAVDIINDVDKARFQLLLTRVIRNLDNKAERVFSQAEETQLQERLELSPGDLTNMLEAMSFIFEQSAYYSISVAALGAQLEKTGIVAAKIETFQKVWQEEAEDLITKLKSKSVAQNVMTGVGWRLHLHLAQKGLSRIKLPSAIFELEVHDQTQKPEQTEKDEKLLLEFDKDELQKLYLQLEAIQDALDNIG